MWTVTKLPPNLWSLGHVPPLQKFPQNPFLTFCVTEHTEKQAGRLKHSFLQLKRLHIFCTTDKTV